MIRYLKNVITGTFARWNETNNKVVSDLWQKSEGFNDYYKIIAQEFISSSHIIVRSLFGPDRSKLTTNPIRQKDIKTLELSDFVELYLSVLNIYYSVFINLNPNNSEKIIESYELLFDREVNPITNDTEIINPEELNKYIIRQGISHLSDQITFIENPDPMLTYSLNILIMDTYIENSKNFKSEL